MPTTLERPISDTVEAQRLIDLARALLVRPEQEIVVNYLDHAMEALEIVSESETKATQPDRRTERP